MMEVLIVLVCLLLNAIFSSIEMAFVTVGKPELRKKAKRGDAKAQKLLLLREHPEKALSVIQIGITLVGAISAAVGGAGAEETLAPIFESQFRMSEAAAEGLAIAVVIVPLTYLSVVIGELVPKTLALRYPNQILAFGTAVLHMGIQVLGPLVRLLEASTSVVLRVVFPISSPPASESQNTELDLGGLSTHQRQYILNLANIETKKVRDAMVPWSEVQWLDQSASYSDVLQKIIQSGHTRLPVLNGAEMTGILHSKEFLTFASSGSRDWNTIIRAAVLAHPQDEVLTTLRRLQNKKTHMAIVVEGGNAFGIITFEDILEEVVGDIFDEDDDGLVRKMLSARTAVKRKTTP